MCFERTRTCDAMCNWQSWVTTSEAGECEPGTSRTLTEGCPAPQERTEFCLDSCEWVEDRECSDVCVGRARTMPWYMEELCVGEGLFLRGTTNRLASYVVKPQLEVFVSSFYVDRYPVTNRRYRACVNAGVCELPVANGATDYMDPTKDDHPVHAVHYDQAAAYCAWDGGRRLLTEAEWEKAARGPAPRDVDFPWGAGECDRMSFRICGWRPGESVTPDPVNAYPDAVSFYGVDAMIGMVLEWVSDWGNNDYYADPSSLVDPQGPATGTARVVRGSPREDARRHVYLWQRRYESPRGTQNLLGFRCARDGD